MCYGIFGCYTTTDPWTSARRPIALLPEPPEELDVSFVIFNGRNRSYPQYLNKFRRSGKNRCSELEGQIVTLVVVFF